MKLQKIILGITALSSGLLHADIADDWNETLLSIIRTNSTPPPVASRAMAMMHLSIYDAVNGINPTHRPYLVHPAAPAGISKEAAASAAAYQILADLYADSASTLVTIETAYNTAIDSITDGAAKSGGISWGEERATAMLSFRANDGADVSITYPAGSNVGEWRPTLPDFDAAAFPQWLQLQSFAIPRNDMFRAQPPPALTGAAYTLEFNHVKEIGSANSTSRTADQSEIAQFWADGDNTETPPGHWLNIAQDVANQQSLTFEEKVRLYGIVSLTVADAAIIAWDSKYTYNYWRPITAIREADTDSNADTIQDSTWTPFIATPPFPEYTSGHSSFSRSAATVLASYFGRDDLAFTTGSDALPGVFRSYPGFSAAADEAGVSRIYGGIHFDSGNIAGQAGAFLLGRMVGEQFLTPLNTLKFTVVRPSSDGMNLQAQVTVGETYLILASSDMSSWQTLGTLTAGSAILTFTDTDAPSGKRFYQLVKQ
ncbi:MAG: phosphatase PAP2 family protein [Akkermansiaceae bacterium]